MYLQLALVTLLVSSDCSPKNWEDQALIGQRLGGKRSHCPVPWREELPLAGAWEGGALIGRRLAGRRTVKRRSEVSSLEAVRGGRVDDPIAASQR